MFSTKIDIKKHTLSILILVFTMMTSLMAKAELIVLASPQSNDPYYAKMKNKIFDFHVNYAKKIIQHGDQVLILTDHSACCRQVAMEFSHSASYFPWCKICCAGSVVSGNYLFRFAGILSPTEDQQ